MAVVAVIDWYAVFHQKTKLGYVTKPSVMLALLLWLIVGADVFAMGGEGAGLQWFFWGLVFSLIGDVLFMLPKRQFIAGLGAFLLGHLAYIRGLWLWPWEEYMVVPGIVLGLVILPFLGMAFWQLIRAVAEKKKALIVPVTVYCLAISVMVYLAIFNAFIYRNWLPLPGYLLVSGALLYMFSDMLLGWNKFVAPIENGKIKRRIPYHLGQILLTLGAALYFMQF